MLFELAGGIGLFLLGMSLLTSGLKSFAGDALRRILVRFTGNPFRAFSSGLFATLLMQSSSATTVTVIGFVSAGLLTFPQAIGVVFGASLGTTGTGWIVSTLGLKISLGFYAMPLVALGAFIELLGRGRWKSLGIALAGFALIFVGIDTLQRGMETVAASMKLSALPPTGALGAMLAVGIGIVMTLLLQSSSAAIATVLTALHTGTVTFEQSAALAIGAAIGTTATGVIAAIGGSVSAKRTALAHVLFNFATGMIALALLPGYLWWIAYAQAHWGLEPGAMSLAAFHTAFIAVGVIIFLPFVQRFARLIERMAPESGPALTRHLDRSLYATPPVAIEASRRALTETAVLLISELRAELQDPRRDHSAQVAGEIQQALEDIQDFLARVPSDGDEDALAASRVALLHAIDHLSRLRQRMPLPASVRRAREDERLKAAVDKCLRVMDAGIAGLCGQGEEGWLDGMADSATQTSEERLRERPVILHQHSSEWTPSQILGLLDAIRWVERISHHTWRVCHYLSGNGENAGLLDRDDVLRD